jgi:hypothetical protein
VSVRELVAEMQRELRTTDLQPDRACEMLASLTSLSGNCADEVLDAEMAYNAVLLAYMEGDEAANRAAIKAKTTPAYQRLQVAKNTTNQVTRMVSSLKLILRVKQEEMRFTR